MTELPSNTSGMDRDILSVTQLNRRARQLLETHLPLIWVEGEVSNISQPSSGHWYFTLKDDQAQVRCAMFRNRNSLIRFQPKQGQQILVRARVSLYEGRGDYQLIAEHMEEAGFGALQRAFEALKQQLAQEGLFDPAHKQALPPLPRHIGVITSPTGAAVRDIITVLRRRFPGVPVTVIPVPVQGKEAAPAIVRALELANSLERVDGLDLFDVLIVARGGGSLEDLWPFNEEIVARAIHASRLPVVSAVGHETDFTIADFVADLRAPTPSAAAELITPDAADWLDTFKGYALLLQQGIQRRLASEAQRLNWLHKRLRHPGDKLRQQSQRLDSAELRLTRAIHQRLRTPHNRLDTLIIRQRPLQPTARLGQLHQTLSRLSRQLHQAARLNLQRKQQRLAEAARLLNTISPLNTLERGYSITRTTRNTLVTHSTQVQPDDQVITRLARGELRCRVVEIIAPSE